MATFVKSIDVSHGLVTGGTAANPTEDDLSLSDVTTLDVSATKHGFAPKHPNDTTKVLRGDGTWAAVPAGGTPAAHATTHQSGGSDPIKLDDLAAPDDNTDLNASTSAHGLLPKLGGGTTNYLRADGTWATPPGSGVTGVTGSSGVASSGGAAPNITLDLNSLTALAAPFYYKDLLAVYDHSAAAHRNIDAGQVAGLAGAVQGGRLTLTSGTSVTTSDVTGATTLHYTSFCSNKLRIPIWDGTTWRGCVVEFEEFANYAPSLTSGKNYDVYAALSIITPSSTDTGADTVTFGAAHNLTTGAYIRAASTGGGLTIDTGYWARYVSSTSISFHPTLADAIANTNIVDLTANITQELYGISLVLSSAWTDDTTRADSAPALNGGVIGTTISTTGTAWLGTIRASGSNTMEDSVAKRFVWNAWNQVGRSVYKFDGTDGPSNYSTDSWQQLFGDSANKIETVCGLAGGSLIALQASVHVASSSAPAYCKLGISLDSTTTLAPECLPDVLPPPATGVEFKLRSTLNAAVPLGYHYYAPIHRGHGSGTQSWYGDNGDDTVYRSGIVGHIRC